jgi:hypothetical protein
MRRVRRLRRVWQVERGMAAMLEVVVGWTLVAIEMGFAVGGGRLILADEERGREVEGCWANARRGGKCLLLMRD